MQILEWDETRNLPSKSYVCGYCGCALASEKGWGASLPETGNSKYRAFIYICHQCTRPTFVDEDGEVLPGTLFGDVVKYIPDDLVEKLYEEARKCTGAGSYTAAILCCRKLLMHIAVSKGAKEGQNFLTYVEYLSNNHFVPPDAKDWLDHIRKKGNEANHEISIMGREDAEELLTFVGMLLKVIFEFPSTVKKKMATL